MKSFFRILTLIFIVFVLSHSAYAGGVIKMVYKDGDKMPLIAKKPNNSGAYLELFSKAAKKIGYKLEVLRMPKKRLHKQLALGKVDFYPGASFSKKRSRYLYYIENGLMTGEYGITGNNIPDIKSYKRVKNLKLKWLMELGSSKAEIAKSIGADVHLVNFVNIEKVRQFINIGRKTFYVADKELIDYYLQSTKYKSFKDAGLKVHKNCCGGEQPMHMGFSRFSPHFKEIPNPGYDKTKSISPNNFPTLVDKKCVAYKLGKALMELKESGETTKIYNKYFAKK
ncbi:MAG: amino acid ABC transporter substrate-binding protein [Deltaproteobacteria bacterium]|nr:amino acid ABC transporter substrate-binding protein [Deltaproteobacteria bacterium]